MNLTVGDRVRARIALYEGPPAGTCGTVLRAVRRGTGARPGLWFAVSWDGGLGTDSVHQDHLTREGTS